MWTEAVMLCVEAIAHAILGETKKTTIIVSGLQGEKGISSFPNMKQDLVSYSFAKRDSPVGIATGYGLDGQLFDSRECQEIFLCSTASRPALGPNQSPIQWILGALSPGVKRPGREADHHQPLSSTGVKNGGAIYPLPDTSSWHGA
jgi:hypothetical protein